MRIGTAPLTTSKHPDSLPGTMRPQHTKSSERNRMGLLRSCSYLIAALSSIVLVNAEQPIPDCSILLVKEIASVNIKCQGELEGCNIFKDIDIEDNSIYVTFRYGPEGGDEARRSTDMEIPHVWRSNYILSGLVSDHIGIAPKDPKNLFCEIMQKGKPRFGFGGGLLGKLLPAKPDKILGTAEFSAKDLAISNDHENLTTRMKDRNGHASPLSFLEIEVFQKHWRDVYGKSHEHAPNENEEMEPFFRITGSSFRATIEKSNNKKAYQFTPPTQAADPNLEMITPLPDVLKCFAFPKYDEMDPVPEKVLLIFLALKQLKFRDTLTPFKNRSDAIHKARLTVGNNLRAPKEGRWMHPTRDAAMKRIYFSSIGMYFIEKAPGFEKGFFADLRELSKYEVRRTEAGYKRDYEPFGCKTYFDESGNISKIEDNDGTEYFPGETYWEWAKLKSRTAVFTKAAFLHLGDIHYCWGNIGASALRMFLSPEHPLRRAFTPHFYKTHHTCRRAQYSLFDDHGILARGLSMDYEKGLKQVFIDHIGGFKFNRYPDNLKEQKVENCKFHVGANDGMDLHKVLSDYVSELIDEVYQNQAEFEEDLELRKAHEFLVKEFVVTKETEYTLDNVKTIWAEILFRVTGFHNSGRKQTLEPLIHV